MSIHDSSTTRRAWQIDRELRLSAVPRDRRIHASEWFTSETVFPTGDDLILLFWNARVPGSGAPEIPYVEMVESLANQGYDVTKAEALLPAGLELAAEKRTDDLRALTAELLARLHEAPRIPNHPLLALRLSGAGLERRAGVAAQRRPGTGSPRAGTVWRRARWTAGAASLPAARSAPPSRATTPTASPKSTA
jgi:hypothetical protein